ncbi:MAG: hypothetical protein ABSG99_05975 [Sedimentisphaerales bacterium]
MGKEICFIRSGSVKTIDSFFHGLHEYFSKEFEHLFFVNVSNVFTSKFIVDFDDDNAHCALPANFTYVVPKSLSDFKRFLRLHDLVVVCYFSETWPDWWIHHYLRKYSIPLVYIHTHSTMGKFLYNRSNKKPVFVRLWSKAKFIYSRLLRYMAINYFLHDVDTLFISQRNKAEKIRNSIKGRYKKSEVVITNSRFYDSFLLNNYSVSRDYVVFLDSMLPYHGDQFRFGFQPINKELYYKSLNRVLDIIKSILGKEVVICLHPKYNEENLQRDFGERKVIKHLTDEFVAKAELVLFHDSSAVNSAIFYRKNVIQLIGSQFNDFIKKNCAVYQEVFSFSTLDIYECDVSEIRKAIEASKIDEEEYVSFLSNYLITSGEEGVSASSQICRHIGLKYGISRKEEDQISKRRDG